VTSQSQQVFRRV